jgi:hypothetical protein
MKTKQTISLAFILLCTLQLVFAQESEIKHDGIVFPVMNFYPVTPDTGQVIYYTGGGSPEYQYYNGSSWESLGSSATGLSDRIEDSDGDTYVRSVDSGTNDYHQFYVNGGSQRFEMRKNLAGNLRFEVVDNVNYNILYGNDTGVNLDGGNSNICIGEIAGNKMTTASDNIMIGRSAGYQMLTGIGNTMVGRRAGYENEKDYNTFIGHRAATRSDSTTHSISIGAFAGENTEGDDNVFIGYASGQNNDLKGEENVGVGNYTLQNTGNNKSSTSHSRYNVAVGHQAGRTNDIGYNNVFVGKDAGVNNVGGYNNTFLGYTTGDDIDNGFHNTFLGSGSGGTSGNYNTKVGSSSGFNSDGNDNTFLGVDTGRNNSGTGNVFIGNEAGWNVVGGPIQDVSNTLVISNDRDKNLIYGEFDEEFVKISGNNTWQLQLENDEAATWRIGSSDSDWNVGANKFVINNASNSSSSKFVIDENGNVGIGDLTPTVKLDVLGTVRGTSMICGGITLCSDVRYKKDFTPIDESLSIVNSLNGYYHYWKDEDFPEWEFGTEREIGFKAQEVQEVLPELVAEMEDGMLGVDYSKLVPVLVEAIKAQQVLIDDLYAKLK